MNSIRVSEGTFGQGFDALHRELCEQFDGFTDLKFQARVLVVEDCWHALRAGQFLAEYVRNVGSRNVVSYARTLVAGLDRHDVLASQS